MLKDILCNMVASFKADKPIGTKLFGQAKKEATPKATDASTKPAASKKSQKKPLESIKKKVLSSF